MTHFVHIARKGAFELNCLDTTFPPHPTPVTHIILITSP